MEIKKKVTEFHYGDYHCENCNKDFATGSNELPKKRRFSPNISSL